jgi:hypothetical protein
LLGGNPPTHQGKQGEAKIAIITARQNESWKHPQFVGRLALGKRSTRLIVHPSMPTENNHVDAGNNRMDEGKTEAQEAICHSHAYMLWKR